LAVVLENCIQVYDITTMKNLHNIETQFNPLGMTQRAHAASLDAIRSTIGSLMIHHPNWALAELLL
jgi:hypothetical protein